MYRKTLIAHNNSLLLSDAIEELTLCYSKVLDVVSHMTEYFFFRGLRNPCERKTKEADATDYYPDSVSNALRGISLTSGEKLKYSISVARQICKSHRAEINKPVSQTVWIRDIEFSFWISSDNSGDNAGYDWWKPLGRFLQLYINATRTSSIAFGALAGYSRSVPRRSLVESFGRLVENEVLLLVAVSSLFDEDWKELAWISDISSSCLLPQ